MSQGPVCHCQDNLCVVAVLLKERPHLRFAGLDVGIAVTYFDYDVHAYYAQHPAIDDIRKV